MADRVELPDIIRAIVVDANVMPHGSVDLSILDEIADSISEQELKAEIWVPEPVLWEWAEHLAARLQTLGVELRGATKTAERAGLDDLVPAPVEASVDPASVLANIEETLTDIEGIRILRLHENPECAVQSVRDQVLQVGAGRKKGTGSGRAVKTGASDGSSFRLVEAYGGGGLHDVVLLSDDKDARKYFTDRDSPVLVGSWHDLKGALVGLRPADEVESERFVAIVRADLERDEVRLADTTLGGTWELEKAHLSRAESALDTISTLQYVNKVIDVRYVEFSENKTFATALVEADVGIHLMSVWWNDVDDQLEHDWMDVDDVRAELQIQAEVRDGAWRISVLEGEVTG